MVNNSTNINKTNNLLSIQLDTNEITPISNKKPGPGWLQAHIFGGTKPVNRTPTMPFS
jgi:hypothetical protein